MEKIAISTLRTASQYSYASLVLPHSDEVSFDPQQVYRTGPLPQWLVERETFERDIVAGYKNLLPGQPRQLVAGTGVGKSTKLPLIVASNFEEIGVVIFPENPMAYFTQAYVRKNLLPAYDNVQTAVLRSGHFLSPLQSPALYYTSGADLLAHMASKPNALKNLGITFMYLDESHSDRPDYKVFDKLCRTSIMPKMKIFYGSATVASDASMESGGVGRSIVRKQSSYFAIKSPKNTHPSSPMHYMNITKKTLLFLPTDNDVLNWVDYYKTHDVKVLYVLDADGTNVLVNMVLECYKHECFVLITTSRLETSYTLDIDVVIDTGYKQRLQYGEDCASCELVVTPTTNAERIQRAGRVGRHKMGTVFQCDIETMPSLDSSRMEVTFYEYLWYKVFSIEVKDPNITRFEQLTGNLSRLASALLLNMRIPALLALPYVGNRGYYRGFEKVLTMITNSQTDVADGEDIVDRVMEWPEFNAGSQPWVEDSAEFRCSIAFPKQWNVIPYVLWKTYNDQKFVQKYKFNLDNRSVISAVTNKTIRPSLNRTDTFRDLRPEPKRMTRNLRPMTYDDVKSVVDVRTTISPEQFKRAISPEYDNDYDVQHYRGSIISTAKQANAKAGTVYGGRSVRDETHSNVSNWMQQITHLPKSPPSSNSSGHKSRDHIKLVKIDPEKYKYYKFYPLDFELYRQFTEADDYVLEATVARDMKHVDKLVGGKAFAHMSNEDKNRYFLSVLRIHNMRVSAKLQMKSSANASSLTYLSISMKNMKITTSEVLISATITLLKAMEFDRYYVAIDKRSLQSADSGTQHSRNSSGSELQKSPTFTDEQTKAAVALAFGDKTVQDIVYNTLSNVVKFEVNGEKVGNMLWISNKIYMAEHTYVEYKENLPHHVLQDKPYGADVVILEVIESRSSRTLRKPVDGEQVYVLAHSTTTSSAVVYGFYTIYDNEGMWIIDYTFDYGYSGATIVSAKDGAVLAIYCGLYQETEGVQFARVEPIVY